MRWAACVEYDGSAYHGWQSQPHAASVQDTLEAALARVADAPVRTVCSGRTDTGVHAEGQIVHFDSDAPRSERAWLLGTNRYLPDDVALQWVVRTDDDFHARYAAFARDYRYWLLARSAPSALWRNRAYHCRHALDAKAMHHAAQALVGEHDFRAFRAAACQAKTSRREVEYIRVGREGDWLWLDIRANAFLHHMVRNIVGSLLEVGRGLRDAEWIAEVLATGDRRRAGMTAPPQGLILKRVHYPPRFVLPEESA